MKPSPIRPARRAAAGPRRRCTPGSAPSGGRRSWRCGSGSTRPGSRAARCATAAWISWVASLRRANRSLCSGQSMPTGTSLRLSPVPTPRMTRSSARQLSVANACATIAGLYRNDGVSTLVPRVTRLSPACGTEPGERVRRVAVVVAPRLEVVAGPDGVEPGLLGRDREVEQPLRVELLGGGLVAEAQVGHRILAGGHVTVECAACGCGPRQRFSGRRRARPPRRARSPSPRSAARPRAPRRPRGAGPRPTPR